MYKTIFLTHKTTDDQVSEILQKRVIPALAELFNQSIEMGKVESNLLNDIKYQSYFEINCKDRKSFDSLMNSPEGKNINKDLGSIFKFVTVYSINFSGSE